jgi:hypothetical protein
MSRALLAITVVAAVAPGAVLAQTTPPPPANGPLVIERVETAFVVAPDYKVTDVDGEVAHLAGAYAGWLTEDTLFVGGAVYSLANRSDDFRLSYGGVVAGWTLLPERRIQFGLRGLVGLGRATLGSDIDLVRFGRRGSRDSQRDRFRAPTSLPTTVRVSTRDEFVLLEPQLTILTKLTDHLSMSVGAGYRITGYAERLGDRVNGATGSVALQLGGW